MKAAVAFPGEIVVVYPDVSAAVAAAILAGFAVVEGYVNVAAAADSEENQSYHCTDYGRAEQFAEFDTASAVEHDWHIQNSIRRSDFESVGIARELKTVLKDPQP
jgi:hypothetical protein